MLSDAGTGAFRHAPARRTHENERRPALERDAAHEREAAGAIARERGAGLGREQTREHDLSVRCNEPRHRRGERFERIEQDIGEDQAVGRAGTQRRGAEARGVHDPHEGTDPVDVRVVARDCDGAGVDIVGKYRSTQGLGCGDGEHAGAGADIEHDGPSLPFARHRGDSTFITLAAASLHDPVEREQTAVRRAVVAGAERERCLDLDADTVRPHVRAVMCPVHDKTAGFDRREAFEAFAHPVRGRERLECQCMGR